jgi:hypothetical protein
VFRYQAKCLANLKAAFAGLDAAVQARVEGLLGRPATTILGA